MKEKKLEGFAKYDAMLQGRCRESRVLPGRHGFTRLERRGPDAIAVKFHETDVLTFERSGKIVVKTGGWFTVTTKERINSYLCYGFHINQHRGVWYWDQWLGRAPRNTRLVLFTDGDVIRDGKLIAQARPGDEKAALKLRKRVNTFAKLCAGALPLPMPGPGDCWYCGMTTDGKSLGDAFSDKHHLISHMDEGYVVPSLVMRALKERGCGDLTLLIAFDQEKKFECMLSCARRHARGAVAAYMRKRLSLP